MHEPELVRSFNENCRKFHEARGKQIALQERKASMEARQKSLESLAVSIDEANVIIQAVAKESQEKIKVQLSALVTQALAAIYPEEDYSFTLKFVPERGQTSVYPLLVLNGKELDPLDNSGGMAEVISFALRIALIAIGKKDKLLILDEPFTGVSKSRIPLVQEFIQKMGEDFNMQFIITTHLPGLAVGADKSYNVTKNNGYSVVTEI